MHIIRITTPESIEARAYTTIPSIKKEEAGVGKKTGIFLIEKQEKGRNLRMKKRGAGVFNLLFQYLLHFFTGSNN